MKPKVILDGSLFSECFFAGKNRYGMLRVAEEISNQLIAKNTLDIAFANTIQLPNYYNGLQQYLNQINYPSTKNLSVQPNGIFKPLEKQNLYFRLINFLPLNIKVKQLNNYQFFHSFYYPIPQTLRRYYTIKRKRLLKKYG
jgi:hypothetical protein